MNNFFEYYLYQENIHLKYANGTPSVKDGEYHDYNEFVFFMRGNSFIISKKIQQQLSPGSIILIPKEHFHQFCISQPETYERLILGFKETPELEFLIKEVVNGIKIIDPPDKKILLIFEDIKNIVTSELPESEKGLFVRASLVQLLIFLKQAPVKAISKNINLSPTVSRALAIIDEKYAENLSIEDIADSLFISPSTLSHKFSKEMNISIYQYITKKRLSVAHRLISSGEYMTSAALSSGFNDYSCFYRLYKKYYKK